MNWVQSVIVVAGLDSHPAAWRDVAAVMAALLTAFLILIDRWAHPIRAHPTKAIKR